MKNQHMTPRDCKGDRYNEEGKTLAGHVQNEKMCFVSIHHLHKIILDKFV